MNGPVDTWLSVLPGAIFIAIAWGLAWSAPAIAWKRNDVADVAWGGLFPMLALLVGGATVAFSDEPEVRALVALVLVFAWGLRLTLHIAHRFSIEREEDRRYARWREQWGEQWRWRSVAQVFVLQALIAFVVAQPVLIAVTVFGDPTRLGVLDLVAVCLVVGGMLLEAVADLQLARFRRRRAAGTEQRRYLTSGTWAWSRHPNYAGDAIAWVGFGLLGVAAALDAGAPVLILPALLGPAVMVWLLRFGSGVALAERDRAGTPEWDAYADRTSAFLPRPPRGGEA
jgi:steroid 5-alpha reductase family enzyme